MTLRSGGKRFGPMHCTFVGAFSLSLALLRLYTRCPCSFHPTVFGFLTHTCFPLFTLALSSFYPSGNVSRCGHSCYRIVRSQQTPPLKHSRASCCPGAVVPSNMNAAAAASPDPMWSGQSPANREVAGTKKVSDIDRRGTNDGNKVGNNANIGINNGDCCDNSRPGTAGLKKSGVGGVGGAARGSSRQGCTCMCSFCQCVRAAEP